jgi:hypothetical protein
MISCLLSLDYTSTWILLTIGMPIRLLYAATTPWCFDLGGYVTLPQLVQPWVTAPMPVWLGSTIASMTRHRHRIAAKLPRQRHRQHGSTALEPAWLGVDIVLWPSRPDSTIASMTRYRHHATAKSLRQRHRQHDSASTSRHGQVALAASSPAWLNSTIVSMTLYLHCVMAKSPRQHHFQHDSTSTSHRGQVAPTVPTPVWLGSAIINMARQRHRATTNVTSGTPSPTWFNIDITQWLDHWHHQWHMFSAASWHAVSLYQNYSPIYLILGPMQVSCCPAWHLRDAPAC